MADTLATLSGPAAVASGTSTLFTVPALHTYTIVTILILNRNASARTVKLGVDGVADGNLITPPVALAQNEQGVGSFKLSLAAGKTLQVNTDGTGVTVTVSGLDQK